MYVAHPILICVKPDASTILCAQCGQSTASTSVCTACGEDPALVGRYELLNIVGRGATGTTFRARNRQTGHVVAVKEIPLRHADEKTLERLDREARVLRQLDHPSIPKYIEHFDAGVGRHQTFYLIQAFIDGPTLKAEQTSKRYREEEVLDIIDELLMILDYLHTLRPPIVHRDIKPKNVIRRSSDNRLILIDFGSVRDVVQDPKMGGSTIAGTYGYMAPEQFKGDARPVSDLYSLGVLGVTLLSRKSPIDLVGTDHLLDWKPHVHASPPLTAYLDWLLDEDPSARPPDARSALTALARVRDGLMPKPEASEGLNSVAPTMVSRANTSRTILSKDDRKRLRVKSRKTAIILAMVGSFWGLHNWYLNRSMRALFCFIFSWTMLPLLMSVYDIFTFATQSADEFDEQFNPMLNEFHRLSADQTVQQLRELHRLTLEGALTQDEFEREKVKLLGNESPTFASQLGLDMMPLVGQVLNETHDRLAEAVLIDVVHSTHQSKKAKKKRRDKYLN